MIDFLRCLLMWERVCCPWTLGEPLCGHFQAWGMTTTPSKPPTGEVLASFDDKVLLLLHLPLSDTLNYVFAYLLKTYSLINQQ